MGNLKMIVAALLAAFSALAYSVNDESGHVKINHNGRVIEVNQNAVSAHLGHGDTLYQSNPNTSSSAQ